MKFNLQIHQKTWMESEYAETVDLIDAHIFEYAAWAISLGGLGTKVIDGRNWTWLSYAMLKKELPILNISVQTFYRRICNLCDVGLLEKCAANEDERRVYMSLTRAGRAFHIKCQTSSNMDESNPFTDEGVSLHERRGIPSQMKGYNDTKDNYTKENTLERETRTQEVESNPILEQTNHKAEEVAKPQITTLDIPFCEGHKMKIAVHEYPKQPKGAPFIHPDLVGRIPMDKRIELWWALYGIKQAEMKVEFEMIQAGIADDATYAEIYRHTFLYVAVTDTRFRSKPLSYWKNKEWKDDIIDRREKKEVADSTGIAITNAPEPKSRMEREAEEREIQRRIEAKLEAEHEAYISGIEKALEERDRRANKA